MTMISAKIIADSKNTFGDRITTMVITFPRFILAELNTHRVFSRNSASSRAIPFEKMVKAVQENPFIPIAWQKDHKGMQGNEYLTDIMDIQRAEYRWLLAKTNAVEEAKVLSEGVGVTKQLCNRLLEPFMWHTVIVTATEWENFFYLRCPQYEFTWDHEETKRYRSRKDLIANGAPYLKNRINDNLYWLSINKSQAEIHIQAVAEAMWDAYNESTPKELKAGEWHIPFGDQIDIMELDNKLLWDETKTQDDREDIMEDSLLQVKIATAMCARVSYTVVGQEGKAPNYEDDIALHDRLSKSGHLSPFEHCARAMSEKEYHEYNGSHPSNVIGNGWSGNFKGFIQYRKMFNNENITK